MKNELKGLREHSEEVEMLMGQTPNWIFRWGITLIAVIITSLLAATWFIHWPETMVVHGELNITGPDTVWYMQTDLTAGEVRQLRSGMKAHVSLDNKDEDWGYYGAVISELPQHPDSSRRFTVTIQLTDNVTDAGSYEPAYLSCKRRTKPWYLDATATIYLTNRRLFHRLLKR